MFRKIKSDQLSRYIKRIDELFPHFGSQETVKYSVIEKYYNESYWGYRLLHSGAGAIHMAMSPNGEFSKNDYFAQVEEIGDLIEEEIGGNEAKILEVGCGAGFNLAYLASRFPRHKFIGVDIARKNLEAAEDRLSEFSNAKVQYESFDVLKSVENESVNLVFGIECICHSLNLRKSMARISEVLVKRGLLVIFDGVRSTAEFEDETLAVAVDYVEKAMAVPRFFTEEEIREVLDKSAFDVVRFEDRSNEIMPNLLRLSDMAKAFFKFKWLSKRVVELMPDALVKNAIAGILMAITIQQGAHKYIKIVAKKS